MTNTNNSGAGSLRQVIIEDLNHAPRVINFAVSGVITLKNSPTLVQDNVTINFHSTPGNGVVIEGAPISIEASNVIIRGMRCQFHSTEGLFDKARDAESHRRSFGVVPTFSYT